MPPRSYDVIILGLGAMGSAAAWHLAARGRRVLGLDRFSPPHDRGSSHGRTRVIRQAYFEHPSYVPLLRRAYELWRDLERLTNRQLLRITGGLMLGPPDCDLVAGSLHSAKTYALPHELLDARQIRQRFPPFQIEDRTAGLLEPEAGFVFCEAAIRAQIERAARSGAALHFEEPINAWAVEPATTGVAVTTSRNTYTADQLVITPGPWAPAVLGDLGCPFVVERQVLLWFQPPGGIRPFLPERFPVFIWQHPSGATPYGLPAIDGPDGGVKAAFYRKPVSETCSPETADRRIREDDVSDLRRVLRDFLPALDGPVVHGTSCLYTLSPDLNFVIGEHPAHPRVKIAAGFSGHGFKFAPIIGEIVADLVTAGRCRHDIELFNPRRFVSGHPAPSDNQ